MTQTTIMTMIEFMIIIMAKTMTLPMARPESMTTTVTINMKNKIILH